MKKLIFALLAQACLFCSCISADVLKVIVTSKSPQKTSAVLTAFEKKFPKDEILLLPYNGSSEIPEEPIGRDTALEGALNRIQHIPSDLLAECDYVVSIENFIEYTSSSWYDLGLVLFQNLKNSSENIIVLTQPTFVPTEYIELAKTISDSVTDKGLSTTIGKAIQKSLCQEEIDPQDWHKEKIFGGVSRSTLLEEALFKALHQEEIAFLKNQIISYPNFPKSGILFEDFFPLLQQGKALEQCVDLLYERYKDKNIEIIVGLESRGFILGAALAYKLGIGFAPIRKPGKLPCPTHSITYNKEYGTDTLVISQSVFTQHKRVLIMDDLIATGGSAKAAIDLVRLAGGSPVEFVSLLEVKGLNGRSTLGIPSFNLLD